MKHIIGIVLTFTILFFVLPVFAYLFVVMLVFKKVKELEVESYESYKEK